MLFLRPHHSSQRAMSSPSDLSHHPNRCLMICVSSISPADKLSWTVVSAFSRWVSLSRFFRTVDNIHYFFYVTRVYLVCTASCSLSEPAVIQVLVIETRWINSSRLSSWPSPPILQVPYHCPSVRVQIIVLFATSCLIHAFGRGMHSTAISLVVSNYIQRVQQSCL